MTFWETTLRVEKLEREAQSLRRAVYLEERAQQMLAEAQKIREDAYARFGYDVSAELRLAKENLKRLTDIENAKEAVKRERRYPDVCLHCHKYYAGTTYRESIELYWLLSNLLLDTIGGDPFRLIMKLAGWGDIKQLKRKHSKTILDRCLMCNKRCHIAYCNAWIKGHGIDYCSRHHHQMYPSILSFNQILLERNSSE